MPKPRKFRKSVLLDEIRRAGYPREIVDEIDSQVPDPVDFTWNKAFWLATESGSTTWLVGSGGARRVARLHAILDMCSLEASKMGGR